MFRSGLCYWQSSASSDNSEYWIQQWKISDSARFGGDGMFWNLGVNHCNTQLASLIQVFMWHERTPNVLWISSFQMLSNCISAINPHKSLHQTDWPHSSHRQLLVWWKSRQWNPSGLDLVRHVWWHREGICLFLPVCLVCRSFLFL